LFGELISGERESYTVEKRFLRNDGSTCYCIVSGFCSRDPYGRAEKVYGFGIDITARTKAEEALKERDEDRKNMEERVLVNVKDLVEPYVEKLSTSSLQAQQKAYLDIIKTNLEDIVSPFIHDVYARNLPLTTTEIQVADLIKQNKSTKEIAAFLNLSPRTIESHRKRIRKKLGLQNKNINLQAYLSSLHRNG